MNRPTPLRLDRLDVLRCCALVGLAACTAPNQYAARDQPSTLEVRSQGAKAVSFQVLQKSGDPYDNPVDVADFSIGFWADAPKCPKAATSLFKNCIAGTDPYGQNLYRQDCSAVKRRRKDAAGNDVAGQITFRGEEPHQGAGWPRFFVVFDPSAKSRPVDSGKPLTIDVDKDAPYSQFKFTLYSDDPTCVAKAPVDPNIIITK